MKRGRDGGTSTSERLMGERRVTAAPVCTLIALDVLLWLDGHPFIAFLEETPE